MIIDEKNKNEHTDYNEYNEEDIGEDHLPQDSEEKSDYKDIIKKVSSLDAFLEKLISRKLLVFVIATSLLLIPSLNFSSESWEMIAICYIGSQAAIDVVKAFRFGN